MGKTYCVNNCNLYSLIIRVTYTSKQKISLFRLSALHSCMPFMNAFVPFIPRDVPHHEHEVSSVMDVSDDWGAALQESNHLRLEEGEKREKRGGGGGAVVDGRG